MSWPLPLMFVSWGFNSGGDEWRNADDLALLCNVAGFRTVAVQLGLNENGSRNTEYDDTEALREAGLRVVVWGVADFDHARSELQRLGAGAEDWFPQIEGPSQRDLVLDAAERGLHASAIVTNYAGAGDTGGEAEDLRAAGVKAVFVECYNDAGPIEPYIDLDRMLWQGTAYGWKESELFATMGAYRGETAETYGGTDEIGRAFGVYLGEPMSEEQWESFGELNADDPNPIGPTTKWYEAPYPTNPKPPAVQQPRWLYPPDVAGGYEMSSDGPDVRAYKVAVSRLGRWPAPKPGGSFDEDYSVNFARGKKGTNDVQNSGIAGIQRQSGLDDTGNLGAKVFQVLRTALIPDGLPNAGEPAFTPEALDLLNGTKFWKYPYEQGPGPKMDFPRPLYAPSWEGEPAPEDGPDVQAYKRAVSRLGRWPWQQFSQTYTDDFAHGTSGNVSDSGVEGIQRQTPGLDDTGNLSKKAFEVLRRALIPPCLPHAHEYAFDDKALDLLKQANENKPDASLGEAALREAQRWIGTKENPSGSNVCKFSDWYGMVGPWCAMFVTYCYELGTPGGSDAFVKGSYYAYVPYIVSDAKAGRRGLTVTNSPEPGSVVCYDWDGGDYDHVGIVESGDANNWTAIEGNTSPDSGGSQSNGGEVCRKQRRRSDAVGIVFVRVAA